MTRASALAFLFLILAAGLSGCGRRASYLDAPDDGSAQGVGYPKQYPKPLYPP